jgi:hypothetical protein
MASALVEMAERYLSEAAALAAQLALPVSKPRPRQQQQQPQPTKTTTRTSRALKIHLRGLHLLARLGLERGVVTLFGQLASFRLLSRSTSAV